MYYENFFFWFNKKNQKISVVHIYICNNEPRSVCMCIYVNCTMHMHIFSSVFWSFIYLPTIAFIPAVKFSTLSKNFSCKFFTVISYHIMNCNIYQTFSWLWQRKLSCVGLKFRLRRAEDYVLASELYISLIIYAKIQMVVRYVNMFKTLT